MVKFFAFAPSAPSAPSVPAMATLEMQLFEAAKRFELETVSALLRDHPEIDVNFATSAEYTFLHAASCLGQVEIVKLLLAPKN